MKQGLLIVNLGTPDAPNAFAVRKYLAQFLSDPRVIDIPALARYVLLYGFILPFRPRQTAKAYQAIWSNNQSPLLRISQQLQTKLANYLGDDWVVSLGMRYGTPSIEQALTDLSSCDKLTVLPLFPQYSSSATGSALEKTLTLISKKNLIPSLSIIRDFYQHPAFIKSQAEQIVPLLAQHDHLLFSFHGLPERHLEKEGCQPVCSNACPKPADKNSACYRAQCYATARALAQYLNLEDTFWSVAFQSRLGKTPWIKPYTDEMLPRLANKGIKNLLVCCPSFTADCLETLEEIAIRGNEQWQECKGQTLSLVSCVNATESWVKGVASIVLENTRTG